MSDGLDFAFSIEPESGGFRYLVWTPDINGGVIGSGDSPRSAVVDAIRTLTAAIPQLASMPIPTHEEILNDGGVR